MSAPLSPTLQPLRIPTGWAVDYNDGLWEVDPDAIAPEDGWWVFAEDMLQLRHPGRNRVLDVMWRVDDRDPAPSSREEALARYLSEGRYRLTVHEGDLQGPLLRAFETRDREALVAEVERSLRDVVRRGL